MLTDDEIRERRLFIGASEVAAICGLNPWMGPLDVYLLKTLDDERVLQLSAEIGKKLAVDIGNAIEPLAIRRYEKRYGHAAYKQAPVMVDGAGIPLRASPDAWDDDDRCPVETKWAGSRTAHSWTDEHDGIPIYYRPQVDTQIAATGAKFGRVVGIVDGEELHYQIERDDALISHWIEQCRVFWHANVLARVEPAPRTIDEAERYLKERFRTVRTGFVRRATPEAIEAAKQLAEARAREDDAKRDRAIAEVKLKQLCGEAEGIEGICTWRQAKDAVVEAHVRKGSRRFLFKGDKHA